MIECIHCGGGRFVDCSLCGGTGQSWPSADGPSGRCTECRGSGRRPCPECEGTGRGEHEGVRCECVGMVVCRVCAAAIAENCGPNKPR